MWIAALNKKSQEDIKIGVSETVKQVITWPPNLPKFIALCDGPEIDTDSEFDNMIRSTKPRTAADIYTRRDIAYQCKAQLPEKEARALFKKVYVKYMKMESEGKIKYKPLIELADKSSDKPRLTKEQAEAEREQVRQMMKVNNMPMIGPFRKVNK